MKRINVKASGDQSPYGIGEIIATYANTPAGLRKAMRKAAYWYSPAIVVSAKGETVEMDWSVVRKKDKGYAIN